MFSSALEGTRAQYARAAADFRRKRLRVVWHVLCNSRECLAVRGLTTGGREPRR